MTTVRARDLILFAALLMVSANERPRWWTDSHPPRTELVTCSGTKEATAIIGPEGGRLRLARLELVVFPNVLQEEVEIRVRRKPGDPSDPNRCSVRDVYSAEPFLLEARAGHPFVAYWYWAHDDERPKDLPDAICPKVSWEDDPERLECYQLAEAIHTHQWERRAGVAVPSGASWHDIHACIRLDMIAGMPVRRSSFFTDRLGHFRLLRPDEGGLADTYTPPGYSGEHRGSSPPPGCREIPDIGLRGVNFVPGLGDASTEVTWPPACETSATCRNGFFCKRPDGRCDAVGVCSIIPVTCAHWDRSRRALSICGCNGRTYANFCEAYREGVNINHAGECLSDSGRELGVRDDEPNQVPLEFGQEHSEENNEENVEEFQGSIKEEFVP